MIIYLPCRLILLLTTFVDSSTYEYAVLYLYAQCLLNPSTVDLYKERRARCEHQRKNIKVRTLTNVFLAPRWLVYIARNVRIQSSSILFPPLWTQLRKLHVDLHISSVPGPDSFMSCFCPSRLNDVNSESISSSAFRCLAISQSTDLFLGIILRK